MSNYENYLSPLVEIFEVMPEGVLCGSNEQVGENEGEW